MSTFHPYTAAARIKPAVNEVELHPLLAQRKLVGKAVASNRITGVIYQKN